MAISRRDSSSKKKKETKNQDGRRAVAGGEEQPASKKSKASLLLSSPTSTTPSTWEANFDKLKAFAEENGHCNVPFQDPKLRALAKWATRQRTKTLTEHQKLRLKSIGYSWMDKREREDQAWNKLFDRLKKYKGQTGHCKVPSTYDIDQELATWVANQRKLNNQQKLRDYRKEKLDLIGFVWGEHSRKRTSSGKINENKAYNKQWNEMFEKLLEFKDSFGHCDVPYLYEDRSLAMWVTTQRREFKQKSWYGKNRSIKEDRKRRLDLVGFNWDMTSKKSDDDKALPEEDKAGKKRKEMSGEDGTTADSASRPKLPKHQPANVSMMAEV